MWETGCCARCSGGNSSFKALSQDPGVGFKHEAWSRLFLICNLELTLSHTPETEKENEKLADKQRKSMRRHVKPRGEREYLPRSALLNGCCFPHETQKRFLSVGRTGTVHLSSNGSFGLKANWKGCLSLAIKSSPARKILSYNLQVS